MISVLSWAWYSQMMVNDDEPLCCAAVYVCLQAGRMRWKPAAGHAQQWERVQLLAAAEAAGRSTADDASPADQQLLVELEQQYSRDAR